MHPWFAAQAARTTCFLAIPFFPNNLLCKDREGEKKRGKKDQAEDYNGDHMTKGCCKGCKWAIKLFFQ